MDIQVVRNAVDKRDVLLRRVIIGKEDTLRDLFFNPERLLIEPYPFQLVLSPHQEIVKCGQCMFRLQPQLLNERAIIFSEIFERQRIQKSDNLAEWRPEIVPKY